MVSLWKKRREHVGRKEFEAKEKWMNFHAKKREAKATLKENAKAEKKRERKKSKQ